MKKYAVVLAASLLLLCLAMPVTAWLDGYGHRQSHNFTGSATWSGDQTDYPMRINVSFSNGVSTAGTFYVNGTTQADFDDIRFTDASDVELDYYRESYTSSTSAIFWVEIPTLAKTGNTQIYCYYGNSSVSTTSSGADTFLMYDDFASLDGNKWVTSSGSPSISSGTLVLLASSDTYQRVTSNTTSGYIFGNNTAFRARLYSSHFLNGEFDLYNEGVEYYNATAPATQIVAYYSYQLDPGKNYTYYYDGSTTRSLITGWTAATWAVQEIQRTGNAVFYVDDANQKTISTPVSPHNANIRMHAQKANSQVKCDWMFVRKTVSPDATHSTWGLVESSVTEIYADFSSNDTYGTNPFSVSFYDTTDYQGHTGASWNWSFGDGSYSSSQNPSHTYTSAGTFNVNFTATSNSSLTDYEYKTDYIHVSDTSYSGYNYSITTDIIGSDIDLYNYQLKYRLYNTSGTSANSTIYLTSLGGVNNFGDIRFTSFTNTSVYPCDYWLETIGSNYTDVWIEIPHIQPNSSGTTGLNILFGFSNTTSATSGINTFLYYDDFETGDLSAWDTVGANWSINSSVKYRGSYSGSGHNWGEQDNPGRLIGQILDFDGNEFNNVTIETRILFTDDGSTSCAAAYICPYVWDPDLLGGYVIYPWQVMENGKIVYNQGGLPTSYTVYANSSTYSVNTWYKSIVTIDQANSLQNAWIGSTHLGEVTLKTGTGKTINSTFNSTLVSVVASSTYGSEAPPVPESWTNIDDFFVHKYHKPEPFAGDSGSTITAAFSANSTTGLMPKSVAFTDLSTGSPATSWNWSFGDGNYSSSQNPTHTYAYSGLFSVNLSVSNEFSSDFELKTNYINVTSFPGGGPTADFTANVTSGVEPLVVQFTDTSVTSGTISAWAWDFNNDGTVDSTDQNPVCNFTSAGSYTVNLTITDEYGGASEVKTNYIVVSSSLYPDADFTANITYGTAPLIVQFTDTSTNTPTAWYWNMSTGGTGVDNTTQNPVWTFTSEGTYTINLTAANAFGGSSEVKTGYITVVNSSTSSGAGAYYSTHDVRWTIKKSSGVILPNIHVVATSTNTSYGAWSWITDLLGLSPSVDIKNSTLSGMTGQDGSITFMMIPEVEYQMHFYNSSQGVDHVYKIFPKDTDYIVYVATSTDVNLTPMSSCINWSKYSSYAAGTATFGAYFTDTCNSTSNVSVLLFYNGNGTYITGAYDNTPGTSTNNVSFTYVYASGQEYKWAVVFNSTYGNHTYWSQFTPPITPITTEVPAWALQWAAVGFLVLLGAIFSFTSVKFGAILIPVFAGVFAYMGWIDVGQSVIGLLICVGALYYIRSQERLAV